MVSSKQKRIIILEKNQSAKDYLRAMSAREGVLAFCFQQENTCLDNIFQLDPQLIVMGTMQPDRSIRFINALQAINCDLPAILFSQNPRIHQYLSINRLNNIKIVDSVSNGKAFKASLKSVFSRNNGGNNDKKAPKKYLVMAKLVVRTVNENAYTLKFKDFGFEEG